jgi:hypothetical protein
MASSIGSAPIASTSSIWFRIWRSIGVIAFCYPSVFSKVIIGVVNTFEACEVLDIKKTSWLIPIWCGVRSKLIDMNSNILIYYLVWWMTG